MADLLGVLRLDHLFDGNLGLASLIIQDYKVWKLHKWQIRQKK